MSPEGNLLRSCGFIERGPLFSVISPTLLCESLHHLPPWKEVFCSCVTCLFCDLFRGDPVYYRKKDAGWGRYSVLQTNRKVLVPLSHTESRKFICFLPCTTFWRFSLMMWIIKSYASRHFPGGPVVKNLPSSAGDAGLIPHWGTKIPHAVGQLSLCAATSEPECHN